MSEGAAKRWMAARGWQPFAFQQQVWQAMAEGRSGLLHATTGAGKTYAVWLGALERFSALAPVDIAQAAPKKRSERPPAAHGAVDYAHARAGGRLAARPAEPPARPGPALDQRPAHRRHRQRRARRARPAPAHGAGRPRLKACRCCWPAPTRTSAWPACSWWWWTNGTSWWATSAACRCNWRWRACRAGTRACRCGACRPRWATCLKRWPRWCLPCPACTAPRQTPAGAGPHRQSAAGAGAAARTGGAFCLGRGTWACRCCRRWCSPSRPPRRRWCCSTLRMPKMARRPTGPRRKAQSAANTASIGKDCNAARWGDGKWQPACEGRRTLLFTNTRSQAERWYQALLEARPDWAGTIALHHGWLSGEVRGWVEAGLKAGTLKAGGVHIEPGPGRGLFAGGAGAADRLGQGRGAAGAARGPIRPRAGRTSSITLVPTHSLELLEAAAARQALAEGRIEDRAHAPRAAGCAGTAPGDHRPGRRFCAQMPCWPRCAAHRPTPHWPTTTGNGRCSLCARAAPRWPTTRLPSRGARRRRRVAHARCALGTAASQQHRHRRERRSIPGAVRQWREAGLGGKRASSRASSPAMCSCLPAACWSWCARSR